MVSVDKTKAYLKTSKVLREKKPWCSDPELQRGAQYIDDFVNGTQPVQGRAPLGYLGPRKMSDIEKSDAALPNFNSSEWRDFSYSFCQPLVVKRGCVDSQWPSHSRG